MKQILLDISFFFKLLLFFLYVKKVLPRVIVSIRTEVLSLFLEYPLFLCKLVALVFAFLTVHWFCPVKDEEEEHEEL